MIPKPITRSINRHHRERIKAKVVNMFKSIWNEPHLLERLDLIGSYTKNRKPCSCYMCSPYKYKRIKLHDMKYYEYV